MSLWCTYLSLFPCKEKTDKCQCFALKVLVLQCYQLVTAKSTKYVVLKDPRDINRMLINSRCYPLLQKASRAPAKPFLLQLLLSSLAVCEWSPSKADPHGTLESSLALTPICFQVFSPADSVFFLLCVVGKAKQLMCTTSITLACILKALEETSKPEPQVQQASQ